jgi:catechol 2,3-dioxygenase-like lactoylglutathione lyase family enzyme
MTLLASLILAAGTPAVAAAPQPAVDAALMAPVLRVADCPREQAYYEAALGMKVLMSRDLGQIHETMLAFATGPARPAILLVCRTAASTAALHGQGASRLIIGAANLDALAARLDAAHLAHPEIRLVGGGVRVLNLTDPEGNELEVVQTSPAAARSHP